jgi:hypothetical protein
LGAGEADAAHIEGRARGTLPEAATEIEIEKEGWIARETGGGRGACEAAVGAQLAGSSTLEVSQRALSEAGVAEQVVASQAESAVLDKSCTAGTPCEALFATRSGCDSSHVYRAVL